MNWLTGDCLRQRARQSIAVMLALAMVGAGPVAAADQADADDAGSEAETEPLWEWYLAAFARYGPSYPGSEDSQFNLVPLPFPKYRGRFLRLGDDTEKPIRGRIFRRDRIKLDIDFDINFGSDSEDIDAREGMPDLDFLLEVGPELELQFAEQSPLLGADLFLGLQLRAAISWDGLDPGYEGLVFSPEFRWVKPLDTERESELTFKLTPTFANDDYMSYFYGVDEAFATPMRPAYDADGGYLGTDFQLSFTRKLGENYEVFIATRLSWLSGAANEDSPLFTDDFNTAVFGAFLWKFGESKRRVPVEPD